MALNKKKVKRRTPINESVYECRKLGHKSLDESMDKAFGIKPDKAKKSWRRYPTGSHYA